MFSLRLVVALGLMTVPISVGAQVRPPQGARPQAAVRRQAPRVFVAVNFGQQTSSSEFTQSASFQESLEDGSLSSTYGIASGPIIDVTGFVEVWRRLSVGVAISQFDVDGASPISAQVPHPFFFNQPRSISGTAPFARREAAVHIAALWTVPVGRRAEARVFGGPTRFNVHQDLVSDIAYTETFPFDAAAFSSASMSDVSTSVLGFNVGGDFTYFIVPKIGVGVLGRLSRATADLANPAGNVVAVKVGGFHVGGGARIRF